jgi:putative phage-type endonuclease
MDLFSTKINSIAQQLLDRENNGEFPKQRTDPWYNTRQNMITASEIASILDSNIYQTSYDLLLKKIKPIEHISNESMEWGNMFEQVAIKFYEFINKEKVYSLGLVSHHTYKWIGASPDGLMLCGKLLEIKCPFRRSIGGEIPLYYHIQMQIQMEVCNIDECDYLECKFHKYLTKDEYDADIESKDVKNTLTYNNNIVYYKLVGYYIKPVSRDKEWFKNNISKMTAFYNNILHYRNITNNVHQLKSDSHKYQKRNRAEINDFITNLNTHKTFSKKTFQNIYINWNNWVSATRIHNYMVDDALIDWLDIHQFKSNEIIFKENQFKSSENTFQQYIMKQGIVFENTIITKLRIMFPNEVVTVANYQEAKSFDKYLETINHMKNGVPIIYQGVLHDYSKKIFGMPDLLVRYDYLNYIFGTPITKQTQIKKGSNVIQQYRVVDIKFISLELCANGKHLRNTNKNIIAYKGQLYIYNKLLGVLQGKTPSKAYILCKHWSFTKCQNYYSGGCFDNCAHINFKTVDKFIRSKTSKAIKWIRDLTNNGHKWQIYSRDELKPNMCHVDKWQSVKKQIAHYYNDITELWYCGIKNREIAESRGVKNWRTHKGLTSEKLGITGSKIASTLQLFIDMNQDISITENEQESLIIPNRIKSNLYDWKNSKNTIEFYIDFETISDTICYDSGWSGTFIFMIGVGVNIDNKWIFKCFIAESLTFTSERNILLDFHQYIVSITSLNNTYKKNLWHWGSAENYLYRNAMNKHADLLSQVNLLTEWCDMLKLFKEEPIITRGMLNFSLKSVVKAFYNNCFIETSYDTDICNGLDAMVISYEYYKNTKVNSSIIKDIEKYNEIDCKVIWEILTYLRKHH